MESVDGDGSIEAGRAVVSSRPARRPAGRRGGIDGGGGCTRRAEE